MGTLCAPAHANIFVSNFEKLQIYSNLNSHIRKPVSRSWIPKSIKIKMECYAPLSEENQMRHNFLQYDSAHLKSLKRQYTISMMYKSNLL